MIWIKYLALIGIVCVVSAANDDIYCYAKEMSKMCSKPEYKTDLCSPTSNLANCVNNSALSCSMGNDKDINTFISLLNEICTEGTEMNRRYKAYWPCYVNTISNSGCNKDLKKALEELIKKKLPYDQFLLEAYRLGCQFHSSINTCNLENIKKRCGSEAEKWVKEEQIAGTDQLNKRLCEYVNGEGKNYFHLPVWVL